jgi:putative ABC transport system permease protein
MRRPLTDGFIDVLALALRILLHSKARFLFTSVGIGAAFFLTAALTGLLVGWCDTTSAVIRHAGVDVWVMAEKTPAFDYGTAIPRNRIYQARSVPGVAWAEGMFLAFNTWQRPDGRKVSVELIGLDGGLAGGPWQMRTGTTAVVHRPDTVIVDNLYLDFLGVRRVGDGAELLGRRAVVGGVSGEVRTFTTLPLVFTSLESAVRYDQRYRDDEITYVLVRCADGYSPEQVREALARQVPHVEVLTTREFALRTVRYWMLETGAGITVVFTVLLGLFVGAIIINQTLVAITQEHFANYATLLALGFSRIQLTAVLVVQALGLGLAGVLLGTSAFLYVSHRTMATAVPVAMTPLVFLGLVGVCLSCCLFASVVSIRYIFKIDPLLVFRG